MRNGLVPSAIDIDQASLPTSPQTGFAWLRGKIAPVYKGARPAGVVVRVDGRDTQVFKATIRGEAWWCQIPQQVFTRGPHTVEATALYARYQSEGGGEASRLGGRRWRTPPTAGASSDLVPPHNAGTWQQGRFPCSEK